MNLLNLDFSEFNADSRVWLYMGDKQLKSSDAKDFADNATVFSEDWKSHGKPVKATSLVIEDQVLVFLVEEAEGVIGGCSIDSSFNFVKEQGEIYEVDFFNRLLCGFIENDQLRVVPNVELGKLYNDGTINDETIVLNTIIKTRVDLENELFIPFKSSWYSRFIK